MYINWYNLNMRTTDITRTACRNIPSAPSMLDRARTQARTNGTAVWWATQHGAQFAFPTDFKTGETWPMRSLGYESILEAEDALMSKGWTVEGLA